MDGDIGERADIDNGEGTRVVEVGVSGNNELGERNDEVEKLELENVREQEVAIVPLSPLGFLVLDTTKSDSCLVKFCF